MKPAKELDNAGKSPNNISIYGTRIQGGCHAFEYQIGSYTMCGGRNPVDPSGGRRPQKSPNPGKSTMPPAAGAIAEPQELDKQICLDESNPAYQATMESYKLMQNGQQALHIGKYDLAIEEFRAALQKLPENDDARMQLAWTLTQAGDPQEAIRELDILETKRPNWTAMHLAYAIAYAAAGDEAAARDHFETVFATEPEEMRHWIFYADAMERFGAAQTAAVLEAAAAKNPAWFPVAAEAGRLYYRAGDYAKAVKLLMPACEALKEHEGFLIPLIASIHATPDHGAILTQLKAKADDASAPAWLKVVYGGVLFLDGKTAEAKPYIMAAASGKTNNAASLYFKGRVLLDEDRNIDAAETLSGVMSGDPSRNLDIIYLTGKALEGIANKDLSIGAYKAFINLSARRSILPDKRAAAEKRIKQLEAGTAI